jgi:ubiquitin C
MIETMLGLPAFMQTQSGGDAELEDTQILKSLHVENGEVLMLYQSVQLFIKTWEGKTLTMSVKMSGMTKDAMKKIEEKLPLKEGVYYLHYRGRVLSPGDTLRKSKIGSNSTIEVRLQNVEEYCKKERSAGELASWARRLN